MIFFNNSIDYARIICYNMHIGIIFYFNKLGGFLNGSRKTDYWFKGKES